MDTTILDRTSIVLVIVGALNWLLFGLFQYDLVASILGGSGSVLSRIIYIIVGLAGLYSISFLFREQALEKS